MIHRLIYRAYNDAELRSLFATEFETEEELKQYLKDHPKADPKKHKVKEEGGAKGKKKDKPDIKTKPELMKEFSQALPEYNLEIVAGTDDELTEKDISRAKTIIKQAKDIAKKVKEGIEKAADVCKMSPPVCEGNLGIGRDNMPQIMDKPIKEMLKSKDPKERAQAKAAVDAGADPKSDKSMKDILLDSIKKSGVKVSKGKVPVGQLKATQKEIQAEKTFSMADGFLKGKIDPSKEQIVISSDNHILDGHHRWASLLTVHPEWEMEVIQVDMPMRDFLKRSFEEPGVFRADLQGNIIPKDKPLDLGEKKEDKKKDKKKAASVVLKGSTMNDKHLRNRLIRLAYENPELRSDLLPILTAGDQEEDEKEAKFEKGKDVPLKDMPKKLQENAKNPPPEVKALKEKMKQARLMSRHEKILQKYLDDAGSSAVMDYDDLPPSVQKDLERVKWTETLWSDVNRWLMDHNNPHLRRRWGAEKEAGCEKLPEGPMRDNCEKKKEEGEKSEDKEEKKASVRTASNKMDLELFPKSPLPETASQVAPKFGGFSWD